MESGNEPAVAVVGAGAVGCYFGGMLARAGVPVLLIGRPPHVEAIHRHGLFLESRTFQQHIPVAAATAIEAAHGARLVFLSVKTPDTVAVARALEPHLAEGALVVSLQNGVDNVEQIRAATALVAVPAVVYVAAEMTAPGHVKHTGRGDLILGDLSAGRAASDVRPGQLEEVAALFGRAGVPCQLSANIEADLWIKLTMNCAYNALSAVTQVRYARIAGHPLTRAVMRQVIEETVAVARAAGVRLGDVDLVEAGWRLADTMPGALSSTAQDLARGKHTEVDALNGYVVRRGAELGIATPVNQTLHALVKLLEEAAADTPG